MLRRLLPAAVLAVVSLAVAAPARAQVLFQQFYYPIDKPPAGITWWQQATNELDALDRLGVYSIWTPVPTKGGSGAVSMGYDPYDLYDLGSKDQKGSVATNFGTKDQYLAYIAVAHAHGIRVYADVVLNHTGGADVAEDNPVMARLGWDDIADDAKVQPKYRPKDYDPTTMNLRAWTGFLPKGADGQPGTGRFPRSWKDFHPSDVHPDRNEPYHKPEFGNDYCYEADGGYVGRGLCDWGAWFEAQTGIDGMRLDAVKLIDPPFLNQFSKRVTGSLAASGGKFFLVGEFWDTNKKLLSDFQTATGKRMSLFDFGLFYALWDMTEKPATFDMRDLLKRRLPDRNRAVSFVSNHDVDRFQPINRRKRSLPYAIILTMSGRPSIFYSDFFRPEDENLPDVLRALVPVHNRFAVGKEIIRYADADILVIEREKNLLGFFNDGGSGAKTVTVPTAFGKGIRLRQVGRETSAARNAPAALETTTADDGSVTLTVGPSGYVLLARADADDRTNPDRFAHRILPTVQVTEFADDLDSGRLGDTPRTVSVSAAQDTELKAEVFGTDEGEGKVILTLQDATGKTLASADGPRGTTVALTVKRLPAGGAYRLIVTAPGPLTVGRLRVRYFGAPRAPISEG